jgi:hypothetical protein
MKQKILHYPNLRTVILVEEKIKECGTITKTGLFRELNNRVMWPTLDVIIDYLHTRRLIVFDKEGKIVWIHNPKLRKKYENKPDLRIKL